MSKKALITGVTGQDGSYLAEFLLEKGMRYMVWYAVLPQRRESVSTIWRATRTSMYTTAICPIP